MDPVWQNPIQRTVRTAHLCVLMTDHCYNDYDNTNLWAVLRCCCSADSACRDCASFILLEPAACFTRPDFSTSAFRFPSHMVRHGPLGVITMVTQFWGSKSPKTAKNRHFPALMPKSYDGNISSSVSPFSLMTPQTYTINKQKKRNSDMWQVMYVPRPPMQSYPHQQLSCRVGSWM